MHSLSLSFNSVIRICFLMFKMSDEYNNLCYGINLNRIINDCSVSHIKKCVFSAFSNSVRNLCEICFCPPVCLFVVLLLFILLNVLFYANKLHYIPLFVSPPLCQRQTRHRCWKLYIRQDTPFVTKTLAQCVIKLRNNAAVRAGCSAMNVYHACEQYPIIPTSPNESHPSLLSTCVNYQ